MARINHLAWKIYEDEKKNVILQGEKPCSECIDGNCRVIVPENETYSALCIRMVSVEDALKSAKDILNL